jgi:hypothetical protein
MVEGMTQRAIVRLLNERGVLNRRGNRWSAANMSKTLANEKYSGTFVYARTKWPLTGGRISVPRHKWIRVEDAIEPVVSKETFEATRRRIEQERPWTDADLLNYLTAAWCATGYLSIPRVNGDKVCPTAPTYRDHFGRMSNAYKLIGYKQVRVCRYSKVSGNMRNVHRRVLCQLTSATKKHSITFDEEKQVLVIDGSVTIAVVVLPYLSPKRYTLPGWKLYFDRLSACDAIFVVRMDKANTDFFDFHLLPRTLFDQPSFRFKDERIVKFRTYKVPSIFGFERALNRLSEKHAI